MKLFLTWILHREERIHEAPSLFLFFSLSLFLSFFNVLNADCEHVVCSDINVRWSRLEAFNEKIFYRFLFFCVLTVCVWLCHTATAVKRACDFSRCATLHWNGILKSWLCNKWCSFLTKEQNWRNVMKCNQTLYWQHSVKMFSSFQTIFFNSKRIMLVWGQHCCLDILLTSSQLCRRFSSHGACDVSCRTVQGK